MPFKNHKRKQIEKKFNSIENPKSETGKVKIIKNWTINNDHSVFLIIDSIFDFSYNLWH